MEEFIPGGSWLEKHNSLSPETLSVLITGKLEKRKIRENKGKSEKKGKIRKRVLKLH